MSIPLMLFGLKEYQRGGNLYSVVRPVIFVLGWALFHLSHRVGAL